MDDHTQAFCSTEALQSNLGLSRAPFTWLTNPQANVTKCHSCCLWFVCGRKMDLFAVTDRAIFLPALSWSDNTATNITNERLLLKIHGSILCQAVLPSLPLRIHLLEGVKLLALLHLSAHKSALFPFIFHVWLCKLHNKCSFKMDTQLQLLYQVDPATASSIDQRCFPLLIQNKRLMRQSARNAIQTKSCTWQVSCGSHH